jgi:hypothetical protein
MPTYIPDASINSSVFNQLLENRGIRFIHKKAIRCPNIKSQDGRGHDPACTFCDNSGYVYYATKEIFGIFESNSLERLFELQGVWEEGTAVLSLPTEYADGTQADFVHHDKLIVPDFQIRVYELRNYEQHNNLTERLRYPVIKMEYAASVDGGNLVNYQNGIDFNVVDGKIVWVNGRQPLYDEITETGPVVSYSYVTNPEFNVVRHMHELRATQEMVGGVKKAIRLPQQILVKKDFIPDGPEKIGT